MEESIQVRNELRCLECRCEWADPTERWRLYVAHEDELIQGLYCPVCASFEFDG